MGTSYNANIATDGLLLCLDPANPRSYPGSGNTLYDLSGNSKNSTLVGTTFSDLNRGKLVLDGSNDYINIPSIQSGSDGFSVCVWVNSSLWNNTTNNCPCGAGSSSIFEWAVDCSYLFNMTYAANLNYVVSSMSNGGNTRIYYLLFDNIRSSDTNKWYYLVSTFGPSSNGVLRNYTNGLFNLSMSLLNTGWGVNSAGGSFSINRSITMGQKITCCGNCWLKADIGLVSIYDRRLSDLEIRQNFNATRGRYGI